MNVKTRWRLGLFHRAVLTDNSQPIRNRFVLSRDILVKQQILFVELKVELQLANVLFLIPDQQPLAQSGGVDTCL